MPYIKQEDRDAYDGLIGGLVAVLEARRYNLRGDSQVGDLNYIITALLTRALQPGAGYKTLNAIIGVLECCKQEWYRRKVAPYEDQKIKENGDVT